MNAINLENDVHEQRRKCRRRAGACVDAMNAINPNVNLAGQYLP